MSDATPGAPACMAEAVVSSIADTASAGADAVDVADADAMLNYTIQGRRHRAQPPQWAMDKATRARRDRRA